MANGRSRRARPRPRGFSQKAGRAAPHFTFWDSTAKQPTYRAQLALRSGKYHRPYLNTADPDAAREAMADLCRKLIDDGRLDPDSAAAAIYVGSQGKVVHLAPAAQLPAHHGAPAAAAVISWEAKLREAARIASLGLAGRASDLAVIVLVYLNHEHGVAFPGVEELADLLKASPETVGRASAELDRAGAARFAKRRGAAVRWFPALLDMSPAEAKAKVRALQEGWRSRHAVDPSSPTDQVDPSKSTPRDRSHQGPRMTDLKTPRKSPSVIVGDPAIPTEAAFRLANAIAEIAGVLRGDAGWPRSWSNAPKIAQQWLSSRNWLPEACIQAARSVMASKRGGPPVSIKYFEPAIERLWDGITSGGAPTAGRQ